MTDTEEIRIRVSANIKHQADELFAEMGLDVERACEVFIRQALLEGEFPFDFVQRLPVADSAPKAVNA